MAINSIIKNRAFLLFIILSAFFIANAIVAEFVGLKIFSLEKLFGMQPLNLRLFGVDGLGLNLTAGAILWPVVFIMTDIINEYYGVKAVRFLSYLAVGIIFYAFFMVYGAIGLPPNEWWQFQSGLTKDAATGVSDMHLAFNKVMGQGLWIIVGSMIAFLVGQILDVAIFHRIKSYTGEHKIWLRATGSTLISQFVDSYIVLLVAFWIGADWELTRVLAIGTVNYFYKFGMAILLTPLIYLVHFMIERFLGHEVAARMKAEAAA
ncbi:MAG: queuosine precursor transporter [Saprospiraceae bacterium]|nr:queuosine precursor transporter [Saprospiraceae bacterium]